VNAVCGHLNGGWVGLPLAPAQNRRIFALGGPNEPRHIALVHRDHDGIVRELDRSTVLLQQLE